jgi:hypothetical protein
VGDPITAVPRAARTARGAITRGATAIATATATATATDAGTATREQIVVETDEHCAAP